MKSKTKATYVKLSTHNSMCYALKIEPIISHSPLYQYIDELLAKLAELKNIEVDFDHTFVSENFLMFLYIKVWSKDDAMKIKMSWNV